MPIITHVRDVCSGAVRDVGGSLYAAGDPYFANVVLLLHGEGADASTTFTDSSGSAHTMTTVGNAQIDTAQFKYGTSSILLDGTGDYLTTPDNADWDLGAGNFTIELWVRYNAVDTTDLYVAQWGGTSAWAFYRETGSLYFRFFDTGAALNDTSYAWTPSTNTWYHVCAMRTGDVFSIFIDGVNVATQTYAKTIRNGSNVLAVGSLTPGGFGGYDLNGWIDDLRITKGVARYSDSGFTPPTAAHPDS